ncbi:Transposable element Tcb1 transposase [Chionoecetes opilio]|uniref:Transposable element Tcb1 transposase n=1 Tax=Chionoecetes opilio TaxID=41210 RepID=A0A8J4YSC4_CHIOP|nr:Transposable element Tcb1 transposase [Chionoecetes opilio]
MGRNKLSNEEKTRALTLLKEGASVIRVAAEVNVTRMAIYNQKKAVESLPPGTVPPRKPGSGAPQKTSPRTDKIMRREVLNDPAITAAELKKNHPALLGNVSVRTIQHRLQISLKLPTRRAANKPLLTEAMKKKRLSFCKRYRQWTPEQWKKVMFSDESTFRLVRMASTTVRRPSDVSRYHPKYTVKTVKPPDSVMVWGGFSGNKGRGGLYFLPKNVTMKGANYIEVLRDHLLVPYAIHECEVFMQDSAPAHRSKVVQKFLTDNNIPVLDWPGNSPDLNPIENAWNEMKKAIAKKRPTNINELKQALTKLWVEMDLSYFTKLATSMPKRIGMVIQYKGNMTKY